MTDLSEVSTSDLLSVLGKRRRAKQATPPRAKVMRQCPLCGETYGARELRKHLPECRKAIKAAAQELRRPMPTAPVGLSSPLPKPDLRPLWERMQDDPFWQWKRRAR